MRGLAPDGSDGPVFKEKLTFVTRELDKTPTELLRRFIESTDRVMTRLCLALAGPAEGQVKDRIPLARGDYGLFDAALYRNATRENVPADMNVASHVDPGLLAVSWYSSRPGLEVYSQSEQRFVAVPAEPGAGVIWAGQAAKDLLGFTPGVHRVQYRFCIVSAFCLFCVSHSLQRRPAADLLDRGVRAGAAVAQRHSDCFPGARPHPEEESG